MPCDKGPPQNDSNLVKNDSKFTQVLNMKLMNKKSNDGRRFTYNENYSPHAPYSEEPFQNKDNLVNNDSECLLLTMCMF